MLAAGTLVLAVVLDALLAEPPRRVHPVALFGTLVAPADREWRRPRLVGTLVALFCPLGFAAAFAGTTALALRLDPLVGVTVGGALLFCTISLRMLLSVTEAVVGLTVTDPVAAREAARALVGRDTSSLLPAELRSGAVESLAENLADGFVAPLVGFVAGVVAAVAGGLSGAALALGVGAAAWVKAVNTLDSMFGYTDTPIGRESARLDDAVMWVPARLSAAFVALAARDPGALGRARLGARVPASPNSGWPMATLAVALDVRLEKSGAYTLNPGADLPTADEGRRAVRVVTLAGLLAVFVSVCVLVAVDRVGAGLGGVVA